MAKKRPPPLQRATLDPATGVWRSSATISTPRKKRRPQQPAAPVFDVTVPRPRPDRRPGPLTPGNTWGGPFEKGRPRAQRRRLSRYVIWEERTRIAREAIPTDVRRAVLFRDRHICRYCRSIYGPFHLDHVVPWSKGGPSTVTNLVVACMECNLRKGAQTWEPLPPLF